MTAVFVTSFISIFIAEFGDKTQLISLNMATRYSPWQVLAGAMAGLFAVLALAVGAGHIIYHYISLFVITTSSGIFFIAAGVWVYFSPEKPPEETSGGRAGFYHTAAFIFLSELGDKTQIAAMLLAATSGYPLVVLAGAMLGMLINHGLAIFLGGRYLSRLPETWLRRSSSVVFILIGTAILLFGPR